MLRFSPSSLAGKLLTKRPQCINLKFISISSSVIFHPEVSVQFTSCSGSSLFPSRVDESHVRHREVKQPSRTVARTLSSCQRKRPCVGGAISNYSFGEQVYHLLKCETQGCCFSSFKSYTLFLAPEMLTPCLFLYSHRKSTLKSFPRLPPHARYRYILNAPGSSAKRSTSADSKASSAKSSSPSSAWRCCHGSMFCQLVRAAVDQKPTLTSWLPGCYVSGREKLRLWRTTHCGAPGASPCRAGASPRRTLRPASGGRLTER